MMPNPPGAAAPIVCWSEVDTVLVDMDGTLLDLAFDNFFWQELVPKTYAEQRQISEDDARLEVMAQYRAREGSLAWYCIDHWTDALGLDLRALKWRHSDRISYLPRATDFLAMIRQLGKQLLLVTNAHRDVLAVKVARTGLDRQVDAMVSSHDFRAPKESAEFWQRFAGTRPFDPARTLLVEDSLSVLAAARQFGLGHVLAIRRPDSRHPARDITDFPAVDGVHALMYGESGSES
jgi:putative hydrolase of the HAD superfamily